MASKTVPRKRVTRPEPCKPVSGKYFFDEEGNLKFENHKWLSYLTTIITDQRTGDKKRVGINPKHTSATVLTEAGHPPRSATASIRTYLRSLDKHYRQRTDKGMKRVRELCLECAESATHVRQCTIINCPLWNHRLGFNPHTWHKRRQEEE